MEQNSAGQNKIWAFLDKYQLQVVAAILIVGAVVYFAATRDRGENSGEQNQNTQATEQDSNQNQEQEGENEGEQNQDAGQNGGEPVQGNVTATGILEASDDPARGNYVLDSNRGRIYISTQRDYSGSVGRQVTMDAEGTLNRFVFLGLSEGPSGEIDETARGGAPEAETGNVSFVGTLSRSDNQAKGNYTITSGGTKVYYQTARDYSAWVGSEVTLSAQGTINSFTNGILHKN